LGSNSQCRGQHLCSQIFRILSGLFIGLTVSMMLLEIPVGPVIGGLS
jgi:hypothetical protein